MKNTYDFEKMKSFAINQIRSGIGLYDMAVGLEHIDVENKGSVYSYCDIAQRIREEFLKELKLPFTEEEQEIWFGETRNAMAQF